VTHFQLLVYGLITIRYRGKNVAEREIVCACWKWVNFLWQIYMILWIVFSLLLGADTLLLYVDTYMNTNAHTLSNSYIGHRFSFSTTIKRKRERERKGERASGRERRRRSATTNILYALSIGRRLYLWLYKTYSRITLHFNFYSSTQSYWTVSFSTLIYI